MSEQMTDGPSEEEMRAYLESLRAAQPVEIVVQSFGILATASEVKLGQPDARVLIDGMGALLQATAENMPDQIVERMRETVHQLQLAQVQAERGAPPEQQEDGAAVDAGQREADQPPPAQQQGGQPTPQPGSDAASRLWIPGRD